MLDTTVRQMNAIATQADAMVNEARQLTAHTDQISRQLGENGSIPLKIKEAQQKVQATIDQISDVKAQIIEERKLAQAQLDEVQQTISQNQMQVESLTNQIQTKESKIQRLSQQVIHQAVWPFSDITIPDPAAAAQMGVLQVEVAGLYTALATVKNILATAQQAQIAFNTQISHVPIEADPRLTNLYIVLESAKKALSLLQERVLVTTERAFKEILTTENKRKIVAIASQKIKTELPNDVEADLFFDAIGKIEEILIEAIPARALYLMQWAEQGLTGEMSKFVERLTHKVNQSVDILMLDETQEAVFFSLLINLLIEAMQAGNTLEQLLENA